MTIESYEKISARRRQFTEDLAFSAVWPNKLSETLCKASFPDAGRAMDDQR
jgi:hypothetical protein